MKTNKERIFKLMSDGRWHTTSQIIAVGGCSGMRRLQEMRKAIRTKEHFPSYLEEGLREIGDIAQRRSTDKNQPGQFEYRFVKDSIQQPSKKATKKVVSENKVVECQPERLIEKELVEEVIVEAASEECDVEVVPEKKADKKWDRESLIVERKLELDRLAKQSRMVPVRSLGSSRVTIEGAAKEP